MPLTCTLLHPLFAAEVSAIDLRSVRDEAISAEIRASMEQYGVPVFRNPW